MIVELLHKEYKENFINNIKKASNLKTFFSLLIKLIFISLFIALEVYIYFALDKKLMLFSEYGSLDFLILFLVILLIGSVFTSLNKVRNVFYKRKDSEVLLHLPVNNEEIIFSKIIFTYLYSVLINFVISVPLLFSYGVSRGIEDNIYPAFYVLSILYPLLISIFSSGLTLILLPLYNKIYNFLKNKALLQVILGSLLVICLCFIYQYILDLFINLINDSKVDSIVSMDFINNLHNVTPYLFPVSGLVNVAINRINAFNHLAIALGISLGIILIGFIISSLSYTKFLKNEISSNKKIEPKKTTKLNSLTKTLLKKEFILIFRNSNYVFSYTSLLIMQPFLAFVVISSLNGILYENMEMLLIYFPELINGLNILLLLLFSSIISSASLDSYSREDKNLMIVKYLPISPLKQSYIKLIMPLIFSSASLLITNLILISFKEISLNAFLVVTILGLLLQVSLVFNGLYIDLIKLNSDLKGNISFLSTLISVVLPLVIFLIHFIMSYFRLSSTLIYIIEVILMLSITIISIVPFKKMVNKYFIKMRIN